MRRRILTAASAMLIGAFWASGASAASAPVLKLAPERGGAREPAGLPVSLNLGSLLVPGLAQDPRLLWPDLSKSAHGVQFELARGRNWDSFDGLFAAAASLNSEYLSGTNIRAGASFALGRGLSFSLGHVALGLGALSDAQPSAFSRDLALRLGPNLRNSGTTSANLNWDFTDWAGVALTATRSSGDAALLGNVADSLRNGGVGDSSALGISARADLAEGWVTTLTYAQGVTQLALSPASLVGSYDTVRSDAYGIGLAKNGLFGNDALGIALSRPLQIYTANNGFGFLNTNFALASSQVRESDVQLGYVTTFLDGTLALQANAAYQLNAAGARGQNALFGVARAKLNF